MRVSFLNFKRGPGVPLLNLEGESWGPTFKPYGNPGSQVSESRGPGSWGPGPIMRMYGYHKNGLIT